MDVKVNVEINIGESTKAFIADLIAARNGGVYVAVAEDTAPVVGVVETVTPAESEKPAEPKKTAKKAAKKETATETPVTEEKPAEAVSEAPEAPAPATTAEPVDYAAKRKDIKAYCAQRKAEGVNIPELVFKFTGRKGAKFSEIPDEKLDEFKALVEAAA